MSCERRRDTNQVDIASQKSKIITTSTRFLAYKNQDDNHLVDKSGHLTGEVIEIIRYYLENRDCVLIFQATNAEGKAIGVDPQTFFLEDLAKDPVISKRLLIIGNLQDITQGEGKKDYESSMKDYNAHKKAYDAMVESQKTNLGVIPPICRILLESTLMICKHPLCTMEQKQMISEAQIRNKTTQPKTPHT